MDRIKSRSQPLRKLKVEPIEHHRKKLGFLCKTFLDYVVQGKMKKVQFNGTTLKNERLESSKSTQGFFYWGYL